MDWRWDEPSKIETSWDTKMEIYFMGYIFGDVFALFGI